MSKKEQGRRRFTAQQKATILRCHIAEKVPVSDLCDEYELQPSVFYGWQHQALQNLEASLERRGGARQAAAQAKTERQITKLRRASLTRMRSSPRSPLRMVAPKKSLGNSDTTLGFL